MGLPVEILSDWPLCVILHRRPWPWQCQAQRKALMRATCRFGRSHTMANPKGFPQEVLLELHLWLTAWSLDHDSLSAWRLKFEKETFFPSQFLAWSGLKMPWRTYQLSLVHDKRALLPANCDRVGDYQVDLLPCVIKNERRGLAPDAMVPMAGHTRTRAGFGGLPGRSRALFFWLFMQTLLSGTT